MTLVSKQFLNTLRVHSISNGVPSASNTKKKDGKYTAFLKEPSSVIMLSGGIDSVAVLKQLLEETNDKIYAHHIHIKNNEGINNFKRYKAEALALRKIIPYMKKTFRDFHYSESTIDIRQLTNILFGEYVEEDLELVHRATYSICDSVCYYMIGGILSNITNSSAMYNGEMHPAPQRNYVSDKFFKRHKEQSSVFYGAAWPSKAKIKYPFFNTYCKRRNIEYLGKELMDMVWYCRHPIEENGNILSCNTKIGLYHKVIEEQTDEVFKCRSCADVTSIYLELRKEQEEKQYA